MMRQLVTSAQTDFVGRKRPFLLNLFRGFSMNRNSKHIRIYFDIERGTRSPWKVAVHDGVSIVNILYKSPGIVEAGDYAEEKGAEMGLSVHADRDTRNALRHEWRREGAEVYAEGLSIHACDNPWRCEGWQVAFRLDPQPLPLYQIQAAAT